MNLPLVLSNSMIYKHSSGNIFKWRHTLPLINGKKSYMFTEVRLISTDKAINEEHLKCFYMQKVLGA